MEIKDTDYILGVWFSESKRGNIMVTVKKDIDTGWECECRLRQYVDEKVFDSDDKKTVYNIAFDNKFTDEQVIEKISRLYKTKFLVLFPDNYEFVEIRGGADKFMFELAKRDWSNIKRMDKAEYESKYGKLKKGEKNE
jgi:hypothetical protein